MTKAIISQLNSTVKLLIALCVCYHYFQQSEAI